MSGPPRHHYAAAIPNPESSQIGLAHKHSPSLLMVRCTIQIETGISGKNGYHRVTAISLHPNSFQPMALAFPSTQWTLVRKLADPQTREDAFQALCKKYWGPVYAFLCQRYQSADAEDITQEFFFVVMKQDLFQRADSLEGKLRSWLLKSLNYCLANRSRSQNSVKRGGRVKIIGMQDECLRIELQGIAASATTPADAFDKAWLSSILHNTFEALAEQYRDTGKDRLFKALQPWLLGDQDGSSQAEAAAKCDVSITNFRVHLLRLRRRYSQELRNQILDTLDSDEQFEDEVQRLFNIAKKTE